MTSDIVFVQSKRWRSASAPPKGVPLVLLDTSEDLAVCRRELGDGFDVGQLLTPLSGFKNRGAAFAIDNGAFAGFDEGKFLRRLRREEPHRARCLFVVLPDVVACANRTSALWEEWKTRPEVAGWPLAYVAQDGLDNVDIPWSELSCLFIGGSTRFKASWCAERAAMAARDLGKWVHVGRVNTRERWTHWRGLADSIDGTGISRFSHMRRVLGDDAMPLLRGQGRP